jgi:hypothetical protein
MLEQFNLIVLAQAYILYDLLVCSIDLWRV